ncbi:MAG: hypothetical protein ABEJ42_00540 [Halobacteriaceae archaeon]
MDSVTRRGVLAAAGATALGGCAGVSRNLPFFGQEVKPNPDGKRTFIANIKDTKTVPPGSHAAWQFTSEEYTAISYTVEAESEYDLDFFGMKKSEFEKYKAGKKFGYATNLSQMNTEGAEVTGKWYPPATYVIVADNTSAGGAVPPDYASELDDPTITMDLRAWV